MILILRLSFKEDLPLTLETQKAWPALTCELDKWQEHGARATLWWRDDDAHLPSAQLDTLIEMSGTAAIPLVLAAIPSLIDASLQNKIEQTPGISIVQHGWSHQNHAPLKEKKCELGDHRALVEIQQELLRGAEVLRTLFGDRFMPVLVPPWNRISTTVADHLISMGYGGLSAFGDTQIKPFPAEFCQVNTHVDLINWRKDRRFIGTGQALEHITAHLRHRRCGHSPYSGITGILTHHLVHDEDLWRFLEELFDITARHPAVHWQAGPQIFRARSENLI